MEYADTLKTLMPTSIVIVENTTVPMGKYVQNQVDNPIEKSVDEMYALQNQVLAEFNKIKIDGEEVPEYLLKALYECLKNKYAFLANNSICSGVIQAERLSVNGLKIPLDAITYPWNK